MFGCCFPVESLVFVWLLGNAAYRGSPQVLPLSLILNFSRDKEPPSLLNFPLHVLRNRFFEKHSYTKTSHWVRRTAQIVTSLGRALWGRLAAVTWSELLRNHVLRVELAACKKIKVQASHCCKLCNGDTRVVYYFGFMWRCPPWSTLLWLVSRPYNSLK